MQQPVVAGTVVRDVGNTQGVKISFPSFSFSFFIRTCFDCSITIVSQF